MTLSNLFAAQKSYFQEGNTLSIEFRKEQLKKLKSTIHQFEPEIYAALKADLNKSNEEVFLTELQMIYSEINLHLSKLKSWTKPQKIAMPFHLKPSSSYTISQPLGVSLLVAPWNYPFQLFFMPLIGAISSGCTAIAKPSEKTIHSEALIKKITDTAFTPEYISTVVGGPAVGQELMAMPFDFVFFTGNPKIGKLYYQAAAANLTPCVLELGGKSPCIVDSSANIAIAARRIVWGKFTNAGQTCIAPDYIVCPKEIYPQLRENLIIEIKRQYSEKPMESSFYGRVVDAAAFERLAEIIEQSEVVYGGQSDKNQRFIQPTLLLLPSFSGRAMDEEIFGPILPIIPVENLEEAKKYILANPKPLAMYYYGNAQAGQAWHRSIASGGGCINDCLIHISNHKLPFGGVGNSGLGKYHGYESFKAFSSTKAVASSPTWIDIPARYAPYPMFKWLKKII